jgi:hypothetical protein
VKKIVLTLLGAVLVAVGCGSIETTADGGGAGKGA